MGLFVGLADVRVVGLKVEANEKHEEGGVQEAREQKGGSPRAMGAKGPSLDNVVVNIGKSEQERARKLNNLERGQVLFPPHLDPQDRLTIEPVHENVDKGVEQQPVETSGGKKKKNA